MAQDSLVQFIGLIIVFGSCTPPSGGGPAPIDRQRSTIDIRVADCDGPATNLPSELRSTLKPRTGRMHPDDHWADLAERVPGGFAGVLYLDGKPTLMLTHPEQAEEAKRVLAPDPSFRGFKILDAQVVKARWDFAQLVDWYNYFVQGTSLWATAGMVSGDKDERINRIRFGIQTELGRQELIRKLSALHVPCDLIRIGIEAPVQVL